MEKDMIMDIFAVNVKYRNEDNLFNPGVAKVIFNTMPMTWREWENICQTMRAETKVKVILLPNKELIISTMSD